jgi:hypothetical protein
LNTSFSTNPNPLKIRGSAVQLLAEHTKPETLKIPLAVSDEQANPKPKKFGVQEHAGSQAKSRHLPMGELELIHVVGNAISEKLSSLGL